MCVRAGAWPANGSRMSARDAASTASALPTVNNVPIRRPSRPSRAISSASSRTDSRTAGSHQGIWSAQALSAAIVIDCRPRTHVRGGVRGVEGVGRDVDNVTTADAPRRART